MTLPKQGTGIARKEHELEPSLGLGLQQHLVVASPVSTTLAQLRQACVLQDNDAGVLTVSGDQSFTDANLVAREASLSQAASRLKRDACEKDGALFGADSGKAQSATENGGSIIEAEIATLERLNKQDTRLCDELRASCRIANTTRGGGIQQGNISCWTLVQAVGGAAAKKGFSSSVANGDDGGTVSGRRDSNGDGSEDGDGGGSTPGSRKRVFSKYDEETTSILTEWFLSHKRWPYPAAKEKDALAEATNLTTLQISNWFTNKRKRHWTPVIKKRTRSPRDFFEFCVMNPKDHSANNARQHTQQQQPPQQPGMSVGGDNPYNLAAMTQRGMNGLHIPVGNLRAMTGESHPGSARGFPTVSHNNVPGMSFDVLPPAPMDGTSNGIAMPAGGNAGEWVRTAGGIDKKAGDGGAVAWLDHSRQLQQQQQQQQQQQGGVQHPGPLAPGLVYASKAARQAVNMENTTSHHHMPLWVNQPAGAERRGGHPMTYSDTGHRAAQAGPSSFAVPQRVDDHRDVSRMRAHVPQQYAEIRGFESTKADSYHQVPQNHDNYRRRDQASGPSQPPSQQQQHHHQQQQQQQERHQQQQPQQHSMSQQQRTTNPDTSSSGQQASSGSASMTPAQQVANAANAALWSSYRAPSPRNLVGPPVYQHHGTVDQTQQRFLDPPNSFYSKGPAGPDAMHYTTVPANANTSSSITSGDYAWREPSAKPETFPPIAAFAAGGIGAGVSGPGFAMNGGISSSSSSGGAGGPSPRALVDAGEMASIATDGRESHQQGVVQQQQHAPLDSSSQYWDRSFAGRGWASGGGAGGAALSQQQPPQPPRTALPSDFARVPPRPRQAAGENPVTAGAVGISTAAARSSATATAASGWR